MAGLHVGRIVAKLQRPIHTRMSPHPPADPIDPVPVVLGSTLVTQVNETTCGAAVLLMLEATGDPALARTLEEDPDRIRSYQLEIHERITKDAVGPIDWPKRFGSPPWTLAREARFPGVTYKAHALDDSTEQGRAILQSVWNANAAGIPVPLYTGGSSRLGLDTAIPRHVVLAVPPAKQTRTSNMRIYEPSSGMLYDVPFEDLLNRKTKHRALGNWTHVVWAVLPEPTGTE